MTSFILLLVTSDLLQRATSATSNERILQRVTSDFTTSNEQRVKSYASRYSKANNKFLKAYDPKQKSKHT